MAIIEIEAKKRENLRKGPSKKYRRDGFIPSIIYGQGENRNILIDNKSFKKLSSSLTKSTVINIKLDGNTYDVLIKDFQKNYIKDEFIHIDFYELKAGKPVHFRIPFNFIGNSKGVREGGILEKHLVELEVECLPKDIMHHIDINVEDMEINDTLHIKDIEIDTEKYKVLSSLDDVIVHISGKMAEEVSEEVGMIDEAAASEEEKEGEESKKED